MSGIVELLTEIGNEKIEHQQISKCMTGVKDKKRDKCTEISFVTDAITANDVMRGGEKVGIVIWVSRNDYSNAFEKIKK